MIQIYTSNYAKARKMDTTKFLLVSISIFAPKGWKGMHVTGFAPTLTLLNKYHQGLSTQEYETEYRKHITRLNNMHALFEMMARKAHGRDIVLLCYEKEGEFCHRHILSDMVYEKYGYRIKEI